MKRLAGEYEKATGLDPKKEHGKWNIVGKTLLGAGIPLIIQAGGDLDEISGKRATFVATPWKFEHGDAASSALWRWSTPTAPVGLTPAKRKAERKE